MTHSGMTGCDYDVVMVGGAFSGASLGLLLARANPGARILIAEKSAQFDRKVGESTSEVAGCFLNRVLGMQNYLSRTQFQKHGLRLWYTTPENDCFERCSEIGTLYQGRLPTFQLERGDFDQEVLNRAVAAGCQLERPVSVKDVELGGSGANRITLQGPEGEFRVTAKWVIDASGKAAWLSRKQGTFRRLEEHPVNAVWCRFSGVTDFDDHNLHQRFPAYATSTRSPRNPATNHLAGRGWWCWLIPLRNGEVSAGLCYDRRLFTLPEGRDLAERLLAHLRTHPVGREIFQDAAPVPGDARAYAHLPQYAGKVAGDGWAIVGDAAGFIDPLYSQGLDYCAHTVSVVEAFVSASLAGENVKKDTVRYNNQYRTSYRRWFEALYRDKYAYIGDAELMAVAFLADLACYYLGPVQLVYRDTRKEFRRMPFTTRLGDAVHHLMKFYNRRLSVLADRKFAAGCYGSKNLDGRFLVPGFSPDLTTLKWLRKGLFKWLICEAKGMLLPRVRYPAAVPLPEAESPKIS